MRKKQFLALLLTGALTVGMAPTAAFAAEEASTLSIEGEAEAAPAAEEGSAGGEEAAPSEPTEAPAETPTETPSEPTEAPAETPTETPSEPTETPTETPTQAPEENPDGNAQLQNSESTPTPSPKATGEGAIMIGTQGYATLEEAIAAAPAADTQEEPTKIIIQGDLEIDATVSIPAGKNIMLAAAAENTTINRKEGFTDAMFKVEGGTLQFAAGTTASGDGSETVTGSLTVDGSLESGTAVDGAIVQVESGTFGLLDSVTLTGNVNSGNGGAINNAGGNVYLLGGTITENNAAEGGAVYSESPVYVQGTVNVTGNKKADGVTESNITLKGETAVLTAINALTGSTIGVNVLEGVADQTIVMVQSESADVTLADVLGQITYDGTDFTIGEDGKLKSTTPTTPTPSPTPAVALKLTGKSMEWTGTNSAKIVCVSNKDGWYYVDWVTRGSEAPTFDLEKEGVPVQADREFTIYLADLDTENAIDVYVRVKDKDNNISKKMLFQLDEKKRPTPSPTEGPSRDPIVPKVTESVVQGLENPLEFHRNTFYEFTVIGAGTQNNDPIQGDVKWVPLYWSTSSNPSDSQKHTTWKIGAAGGIAQAATYNLYVFFQKYEYNGTDWVATDTVESATYQFRSKAITLATVTPTPTMAGQSGGYNDSGDTSDPESQTADGDVTGATSSDPVSTADESPISTMLMLAAVSLLAGGYVLVRRRKKEF
ncbi:MAG: hypothetical protein Q4C91_05880 [Eubacteriales bacterium]|nr:hypothetical protein [Eubacteriales bacterium]